MPSQNSFHLIKLLPYGKPQRLKPILSSGLGPNYLQNKVALFQPISLILFDLRAPLLDLNDFSCGVGGCILVGDCIWDIFRVLY